MKNWSSRKEVTETSGRLHPLWPQDKWLHTPRTTDYRHSRQHRRIQMELAFTLAKNATKPNPFEIIPLQTARKEDNWKTKEALVQAAVTLETERIKGSNHWCSWRWLLWPCVILSLTVRVKQHRHWETEEKNISRSICVFYWYCRSNILSRGILGLHVMTQQTWCVFPWLSPFNGIHHR